MEEAQKRNEAQVKGACENVSGVLLGWGKKGFKKAAICNRHILKSSALIFFLKFLFLFFILLVYLF